MLLHRHSCIFTVPPTLHATPCGTLLYVTLLSVLVCTPLVHPEPDRSPSPASCTALFCRLAG